MKRVYPKCNLITFKPIPVVGRMVRPKRHFPDCWKVSLRGGFR